MTRLGFSQKTDCGGAGTRGVLEGCLEGDGRRASRTRAAALRRRDGHEYLVVSHLRLGTERPESMLGYVPRNRGANTTVLSSMGIEGMGPSLTVEGSTTSVVFEAYVEQVLAPTLPEGVRLW
jgi:hypothetical protein